MKFIYGIITLFFIIIVTAVFPYQIAWASQIDGTIDSVYKHAWGENVGWINFGVSGGNVHVTDSALTGYAWSDNYGWVNLNATTSGVINNSEGTLSGYAWGENTGWIDFNGVTINSSGEFAGYASGTIAGRVNFNCSNTSSCGSSNFKVATDWRPVSVRSALTACNDGTDNDSDGVVDYPNDPGCSSASDGDETNIISGNSGGGGGGILITEPIPTTSTVIGAVNGGQIVRVNTNGTSAMIVVPAGALLSDAAFSVSVLISGYATPAASSNLFVIGGGVYEITALSNNMSVVSFTKDITITLKYLDSQIPIGIPESSLKIHWFNATTSSWEALASTVDALANSVTAVANHLAKFSIIGQKGAGVTATQPSERSVATLIRVEGDPRVYVIINNFKRHIPNPEVFNSYGYKWSDVKVVPASESAKYQATALMRAGGDPKVYAIENGTGKWITSPAEFSAKGYKWEAIVEVNAIELAAYLETAVDTLTAPAVQAVAGRKITMELQAGMRNDQVSLLQGFLARDKSVYLEGKITGYFGPMTKAAVKRFQARYGIRQVGRVGPQTMAKLNEIFKASD